MKDRRVGAAWTPADRGAFAADHEVPGAADEASVVTTAPGQQPTPRHAITRLRTVALTALCALTVALAVPPAIATRHGQQAAYGDRVTVYQPSGNRSEGQVRLRGGAAARAYERDTGIRRWAYTRRGRTAEQVLRTNGHAVTLWSDGLVTDSALDTARVRWHRMIPEIADWLTSRAGHHGAGVLQPLGGGERMLAVVTPRRVVVYRMRDGDLRRVLPARPGCSFVPARSVRRGGYALLAQPCVDTGAGWREQIVPIR